MRSFEFVSGILNRLLNNTLNNPRKIMFWCLVFAFVGILMDGTLYRLWSLNNESKNMKVKIEDTKISIEQLEKQIKMAHDPKFIEREARDRFDLVNKDDIVFVFNEGE